MNEIKHIFKAAVDAVKPGALMSNKLSLNNNHLLIKDVKSSFKLNNNCHVVGFGKAVLGMAIELEKMLGHHVQSGVLSIPSKSKSNYDLTSEFVRKFLILEGAENNIPDLNSLYATVEIQHLLTTLTENSLLFVLISGGGSSLLSSPISGITLDDKQKVIQLISKAGANIKELNSIRKRLSQIKGGKLAQLSYPVTTIALILSDVIGDPLDIIASGPTVENTDPGEKAWSIVQKYKVESQLPPNVVEILKSPIAQNKPPFSFDHVLNVLLGNNHTALQAAERSATKQGFISFILGSEIQGEARIVGQHFAQLASIISQMMASPQAHDHLNALSVEANHLNVDAARCRHLERIIRKSFNCRKNLCLIAGGESTVKVEGRGTGGRNQEMALSWAIEILATPLAPELEIVFLSAGTDGIDGPTDAAGAISLTNLVDQAHHQGLDAQSFLNNNDSYGFFRTFHHGFYHLTVGHTGTNVMDIHIVCFLWKNCNLLSGLDDSM